MCMCVCMYECVCVCVYVCAYVCVCVLMPLSWVLADVMYIVLHCEYCRKILFYSIVLFYVKLCKFGSYCIVLYCIVLYCIVLYCIVLYCIVLYCR